MLPRVCNVYGVIIAPKGLGVVESAIKAVSENAGIDVASEKYGDALWFRSDAYDLRTLPRNDGVEHSLSGYVAGSLNEVGNTIRKLSEALKTANVQHFFDIYDDCQQVVERVEFHPSPVA